jgi:hypothetical protein
MKKVPSKLRSKMLGIENDKRRAQENLNYRHGVGI